MPIDFCAARARLARAEIPLYHRAGIFVNSFSQNFYFFIFPKTLDFFGGVCYTIIVPREGDLSRLSKKTFEKLKKSLDKPPTLWYNKSTKRVATYRQRKELIL
jgi:hypothetical protein